MNQIDLEKNRKYVGCTMRSHDYVYQGTIKLTVPELKGLWHEYEHQFKNMGTSRIKRAEAWIYLQVFTEVLRERGAWNEEARRPMNGVVEQPVKTTDCAYGAADYYTNPAYGWAE